MKILLVRHHDEGNFETRLPSSLERVRGLMPPLGLAYIAGVLENNGYNVTILDSMALNYTSRETREFILRMKPDVVGITAMTPTFRGALEVACFAKEAGAIVVVGGPQTSAYPQETLRQKEIDFVVMGDGEYAFVELLNNLGKGKANENVTGLGYKKDGEIFVNNPAVINDLNSIPYPSRHLLPIEKYSAIIGLSPMTTMITARGCPYRCGFCFKMPTDKIYRIRNAKSVVDEMEYLWGKYSLKEIMFYDDSLTIDKKHVADICYEIINRDLKVKWESPTRIDCVDYDLLRLMKKAGCIRLRYGVESGHPDILKLMKKDIDLERIKKVFQWTKKSGIETFAYFMIGYAYENKDTVTATIKFAKALNPDEAMFTIAVPYPKTDLYRLAFELGKVPEDYWRDYTLGLRNDPLPFLIDDAEKWMKRAYWDFYFRPRVVFRNLKKIKNIDGFKKVFRAGKALLSFKLQN